MYWYAAIAPAASFSHLGKRALYRACLPARNRYEAAVAARMSLVIGTLFLRDNQGIDIHR